jgi:hypothetical protein
MAGITGLLGAIFLISGLAFSLIFTAGYRPLDDIRLATEGTTARGIVNEVSGTNSTENDVPVYSYRFTFTTRDGGRVTGVSYTTGWRWDVEDTVTVEYVPDLPYIARIQGARSSTFSPWVLFVLVFPAVGAVMFLSAAVGGLREVELLRFGEVADARIVSSRPTGATVNDVPVMEYTYEIVTSAGEVFDGKDKSLLTDRIGDETAEPALYLRSNPRRSTLVDAISLKHPLDVDGLSGEWQSQGSPIVVVLYAAAWLAAIGLGGFFLASITGVIR